MSYQARIKDLETMIKLQSEKIAILENQLSKARLVNNSWRQKIGDLEDQNAGYRQELVIAMAELDQSGKRWRELIANTEALNHPNI